ncbi:dolichyl-diphosphooligosaccharide---protein glycosyltransferase [Nematocida sp. AWRm78]|nr:dolichyl-diphosphooligosaccharide---protein glycosyltransferase [Nematocida sp. AWRm79]KAI5182580.1 dolichyl-diphosphooligosaccharide---protein glycosyltransferase [Nematocida sp. AWRm78]
MSKITYKHSSFPKHATYITVMACKFSVMYTFLMRLSPLFRYGVLINEFDPWFNFRCSEYIRHNGILKYFQWIDSKTWIPEGRNIYRTTYPAMFILSNCIHSLLGIFVRVSHYTVCSITPPILFLGCLILMYKVSNEFFSKPEKTLRVWIAMAVFSMAGSVFEKTMAGAYDYEGLSLFMVLLILYIYIRCIKNENASVNSKVRLGLIIGVVQGIFNLSWGGSLFTEILLYAHAFFSLSNWRVLLCTTAVTVSIDYITPFLWVVKPVNIGKVLTFLLLEIGHQLMQLTHSTRIKYLGVFGALIMLCIGIIGVYLSKGGKLALLLNAVKKKDKVYNVLYKKRAHPLVSSIVEHQPATKDQAVALCGPYMIVSPMLMIWGTERLKYEKKKSLLLLVQAGFMLSSLMFLFMERFAFLTIPFLAIYVGDAFCEMMFAHSFYKPFQNPKPYLVHKPLKIAMGIFMLGHTFSCYNTIHNKQKQVMIVMDGVVDGKPTVVDDFRESAIYMKYNLPKDSVVLSWWDYGYQITGMTNLSTVIDNNTNNYQKISEVASLLVSPEEEVSRNHPFLKRIVPDLATSLYIYTVCGYTSKYNLSDLNKIWWISRIANEANNQINANDYYFKVGSTIYHSLPDIPDISIESEHAGNTPLYISPTLKNSLLFKLCFYKYSDTITLHNLELVHESSNSIVRLYKIIK